jgi:tRNA A37 threonylcarbamoyladenosine dehydratase
MGDLDGQKLFFLENDKAEFEKKYGSTVYENASFLGNIDAAYQIYATYEQRATSRINWVFEELKADFDLTTDATYRTDRTKSDWPSTAANADALLAPEQGYTVVVDAIDSVAHKARLLAACSARRLPCVTTGGAGGKRDGTRLRVGDLGESGGDDLLRQVRKTLRREHGFPGGEGHRYGLRAVWSTESPVYPWADGTCAATPEPGSATRLDCAAGLGAAVWVTAAFGFAAAQEAVRLLIKPDQKNG